MGAGVPWQPDSLGAHSPVIPESTPLALGEQLVSGAQKEAWEISLLHTHTSRVVFAAARGPHHSSPLLSRIATLQPQDICVPLP